MHRLIVIVAALILHSVPVNACNPHQPAPHIDKWEIMHVAFIKCLHAKGATAQHTCAAEYLELVDNLVSRAGG